MSMNYKGRKEISKHYKNMYILQSKNNFQLKHNQNHTQREFHAQLEKMQQIRLEIHVFLQMLYVCI